MTTAPSDHNLRPASKELRPARPWLASRARLGALSLVVAGILFFLYPAIRPFSSEKGLDGAAAFGSGQWIVAHTLAMVAFGLLAVGLICWYATLSRQRVEGLTFWSLIVSVLGIDLTLPFYGGEAFGLHAIGLRALQQSSPDLVGLSSTVRGGAGLVLFLIGLLLLAIGTIMVAVTIWRSGTYSKWSGIPFALAFGLYIPQFFGTQPIRVAHGIFVAVSCAWIAAEMWRQRSRRGTDVSHGAPEKQG